MNTYRVINEIELLSSANVNSDFMKPAVGKLNAFSMYSGWYGCPVAKMRGFPILGDVQSYGKRFLYKLCSICYGYDKTDVVRNVGGKGSHGEEDAKLWFFMCELPPAGVCKSRGSYKEGEDDGKEYDSHGIYDRGFVLKCWGESLLNSSGFY